MSRTRNILDESNLIDFGHSGPHFTWINRRSGNKVIIERLDRGAANLEWNLMFPNASIKNYISGGSDYSPIILDTCLVINFDPRPFMFEWMWTSHVGCSDQVAKGWHKRSEGSNMDTIKGNLDRLPSIFRK